MKRIRKRRDVVPIRERVGVTYFDLVAAGVEVTHLPWVDGPRICEEQNPDTLVWCWLGCERVYRWGEACWVRDVVGEWADELEELGLAGTDDGLWYCAHFPSCTQDAFLKVVPWREFAARIEHGYPKVPEVGRPYPLYPPSEGRGR